MGRKKQKLQEVRTISKEQIILVMNGKNSMNSTIELYLRPLYKWPSDTKSFSGQRNA